MNTVTYNKKTVLDMMNRWKEAQESRIEAIADERLRAANDTIAAVSGQETTRRVSSYTRDITMALDAFNLAVENRLPTVDTAATLLRLDELMSSTKCVVPWSKKGALRDANKIQDREKKLSQELENFMTRYRLIEQADGDSFSITTLERLGVLRYFK